MRRAAAGHIVRQQDLTAAVLGLEQAVSLLEAVVTDVLDAKSALLPAASMQDG
jgi:hypothetical protein